MRMMKKVVCFMLVASMMFSISGVSTLASEPIQESTKEVQKEAEVPESAPGLSLKEEVPENIPESSEKEVQTEEVSVKKEQASNVLEYVYLDEQIIRAPQQQSIVVSFRDAAMLVSSVVLYYQNRAGEEFSEESSAVQGNAALFSLEYGETASEDVYSLVKIEYLSTAEEKKTVFFADENIDLSYQVTTAVEETQSAAVSTYAMDKSGVMEVDNGDTIEDVIETSLPEANDVIAPSRARTAKASELVVAVTAGHGGNDPGAIGNGLREADLTGKVTQYFIQELSQYQSVRIVEVPRVYNGTATVMTVKDRVQYAVSQGAKVYLDLHFNKGGGTGAEIFYPSTNHNPGVSQEGKSLSDLMLQQLTALGLTNRGAKIRTYIDDTNGSIQDYYGTIRYCKQNGIAGIVVEHAFLDNLKDVHKLKNEGFLKQLGIADATGVARKYGLSKELPFKGQVMSNAAISKDEMSCGITTSIKNANQNVAAVSVAVWGDKNSQNDLQWYNASKSADGTWKTNVQIGTHAEAGQYSAHTYVTTAGGVRSFQGMTTFNITPIQMRINAGVYDAKTGTVEIKGTPTASPSGVKEVRFPVWKIGNQAATIHWYDGVRQSDGSYKATINIKNHQFSTGTYQIHTYVTGRNGVVGVVDGGTVAITAAKVNVSVSDVSRNETKYRVKADNLGPIGGFGSQIAVWGTKNGQNDLRWYTASKDSTGSWIVDVNIADHGEPGEYSAHVYVQKSAGIQVFAGATTFKVTSPAVTVSLGAYNANTGTMEVRGTNAVSPSGVKSVRFPVWQEGNQDATLHWYEGVRQADGSYKAIINVDNHKYSKGTYIVHTYVTGGNGAVGFVNGGTAVVTAAKANISVVDVSGNQTRYRVQADNVGMFGRLGCEIAVWGTKNGQNDLRWYTARKDSTGSWIVDVNIADHGEAGEYSAHAYARQSVGINIFAGATSFQVTAPTMSVNLGTYNANAGTLEITGTGIVSPSGVKRVQFPVWREGKQDATMHWYEGVRQSNGSYKALINLKNHKYNTGTYIIHTYITGGNGAVGFVNGGRALMDKAPIVTDLYAIMGTSSVTVGQMVNMFKSYNKTYPTSVMQQGGAATIQQFCQIAYEEALAEGVKAEVLFAQMMHETGFLTFTGDVKINQFNFGGLGATGGGNPGNSFPDVRTGMRAQVQHLKCYASNEPLKQTNVDPRWGEWLRNKAPYIEWLSIPHNPYGTGWAVDANYAPKLIAYINKMKSL